MAVYQANPMAGLRQEPPVLSSVYQTEGKFRILRFTFLAADGALNPGDVLELVELPPGRILVLGHSSSFFSGGGDWDVGHSSYLGADGVVAPADENRFGSALPDGLSRLTGDGADGVTEFDARSRLLVRATLVVDPLPQGEEIEGYLAYTIS